MKLVLKNILLIYLVELENQKLQKLVDDNKELTNMAVEEKTKLKNGKKFDILSYFFEIKIIILRFRKTK